MEDLPPIRLRHAVLNDLATLHRLADLATRELCASDYTPEQIQAIVTFGLGVDPQLIRDRTYFVAEHEDRLVGAGGWTRRPELCNLDDTRSAAVAAALDPARRDTARIRGFFVHPDCARRGIGRTLLAICTTAAIRAGFRRVELVASLTGRHLFRAAGFTPTEAVTSMLPNGVTIEGVRMHRLLDEVPQPHVHSRVQRSRFGIQN
jgi:GNAT superfamily N-acetyltransferase